MDLLSNDDDLEVQDVANRFLEHNSFHDLYNNPNAAVNDNLRLATLKNLEIIAEKRKNLIYFDQYHHLMEFANEKQRERSYNSPTFIITKITFANILLLDEPTTK